MNNRFLSWVETLCGVFVRASASLKSPFLLAVRLYWGWQFAQTGWGKLHNLAKVTEFFTSLNIPFPHANAIFVGNVEFLGGLLLIAGVATRFTGLVLTGNMLVAYVTADREALQSIFSDPSKFYSADPYTYLFAAVIVLIFGAGYFSIDEVIGRFLKSKAYSKRIGVSTTASVSA